MSCESLGAFGRRTEGDDGDHIGQALLLMRSRQPPDCGTRVGGGGVAPG